MAFSKAPHNERGSAMSEVSTGTPPSSFFEFGKQRTEAMARMQKELVDAYEHAGRLWLARVQSEAEFWSQLGAKLTATRSVPDAMTAYQESMSQRIQMVATD